MREIKFRAWDGEKMRGIGNLQDRFSIRNDGVVNNNGDYVLMQYAGIKDSSNKDVYEGDIVWTEIKMIGVRVLGQVVFREAMFCCVTPILPDDLIPLYGADKIDIIGNIHENPELLENKNGN